MWFSFYYSVYICLFIQSDVNKSRWKRPPVFIYLCKTLIVTYGFRLNIHDIFIYLFKVMSTKALGNRPPVFIYLLKSLVVTRSFRFNIHYLFVYLFKLTSIERGGTDNLFLFTYANYLL